MAKFTISCRWISFTGLGATNSPSARSRTAAARALGTWSGAAVHRCRSPTDGVVCCRMNRGRLRSYSITSSARSSSDCGIVRPSALAVLRLITSSNRDGCSTGRSPGLAPFKIRSTYRGGDLRVLGWRWPVADQTACRKITAAAHDGQRQPVSLREARDCVAVGSDQRFRGKQYRFRVRAADGRERGLKIALARNLDYLQPASRRPRRPPAFA